MKKYFMLLISLFISAIYSKAQVLKLSDNPNIFITDLQSALASSQQPAWIDMGKKLETNWTQNTISAENKTALATLCNNMVKKGYKLNPTFLEFFDGLNKGIENKYLTDETLKNYLSTLQKTLDKSDSKTLSSVISISRNFFYDQLIYTSNFNRLYGFNAQISYQYFDQKTEINKPKVIINQPIEDIKPQNNFDSWDTPIENISLAKVESNFDESKPQIVSEGPAILLTNTNLTVATTSDSIAILNTTATVSIKDGMVFGQSGTFKEISNPSSLAIFKLGSFRLGINSPKITCEDTELNYSNQLTAPVKGVFEYDSKKRPKNVESSFPKFMSLRNDVVLSNLGKDLEYIGGFSMSGKKIYSMSTGAKYASITIKKDNKKIIKLISSNFELSDSLITSNATIASIYFAENDSIYNPNVKLKYNKKTKDFQLSKIDKGGFKDMAYKDTYHKLYITTDALQWNIGTDKIDFKILSAKNLVPATFESFDYFNAESYNNAASSYNFNPLVVVNNFAKKMSTSTVSIYDIARTFNKDVESMRPAMLGMMQKGYMNFDPDMQNLSLSTKGVNVIAASQGRKDYDSFFIKSLYNSGSKDSSANASLNLTNYDLNIKGVRYFDLSDSLNVYLTPKDKIVTVKKDRSFQINGTIKTGNFKFVGKKFAFNYNDFSVKLNEIDSITFIPQKLYQKGETTEVGGDLRYDSGTLFINKPDNKSGKLRLLAFPRLLIPNGVTAYFDHPYRAKGAYLREVYFKVPTIDYDSLNTKDIDFVGTFHSDGMFPKFTETLKSMPDNTLGFEHKVPSGKYPVYNDKSFIKFSNQLVMDKTGLHTKDGELNHITAQITGKEILITPDSLLANGKTGIINEGTLNNAYFTKVNLNDYSLKWQPKVDSMEIQTKGNSFDFYNTTTKLQGKIYLRQTGIYGSGLLKRTDSETESNAFKFNKEAFTAESANFIIGNNLKNIKPSLLGKNTHVDFNIQAGIVKLQNTENTLIGDSTGFTFPYSSFRTTINKAEWNIAKKTISMSGDVNTSTFTSTAEEQEGLNFNGSEAMYEIDNQSLNVKGVPSIKSADALIFPDKGNVSIKRDAEIKQLYNAKIQIDTVRKYHNLSKANVRILSKNKFEGDGIYRFVNIVNDTLDIKMGNFELKEIPNKNKTKQYVTYAKAIVERKDNFHISPKILYSGEIEMLASEKNLKLNGYVKPDIKNRPDSASWVAYNGNSSENASVELNANTKDEEKNSVTAGLHLSSNNPRFYTTFLSSKWADKDENIFIGKGIITDIPHSDVWEIAPKNEKFTFENSSIKYLNQQKTIKASGTFSLFKPETLVQCAGTAEVEIDSLKNNFDQMLVLNFPIPAEILKVFAEKIVKTNLNSVSVDPGDMPEDRQQMLYKLAQIVGGKTIDPLERKIMNEHVPLATLNSKLTTTMVISKANLKWSEANSTFYSTGKLHISNIGNIDINAQLDGVIEIRKNNTGDEFYLYLEPNDELWYYFGYLKNEMGVMSSDNEFNNTVLAKTKNAKKITKEYNIVSALPDEKNTFVDRINELYGRNLTRSADINTESSNPKTEVLEQTISEDTLKTKVITTDSNTVKSLQIDSLITKDSLQTNLNKLENNQKENKKNNKNEKKKDGTKKEIKKKDDEDSF
ncbi:MAG: hypothetical protein KA327_01720 [Pseudarcicella sp.]|nr:hypothetical protein [Pseudarcicella sp.]